MIKEERVGRLAMLYMVKWCLVSRLVFTHVVVKAVETKRARWEQTRTLDRSPIGRKEPTEEVSGGGQIEPFSVRSPAQL